jgi:NADH-quinone oxidoreductase subunit G
MSDSISIEIDGDTYPASKGEMLITVADRHGIRIPRFCYHKKLTVAANCRMCLVEVERAPKPLPACATPVMDGMKVHTRSALARKAQKSVMEFLLINHPLDCPICDQGGECELQDVAMGYGRDVSRFVERKRVVRDKNLGPLIATDMTRCIHCTRCVRFGEEIAGLPELGATGRGENLEIGTFIEKSVDSELSGNVIDLCPVGALTNKPFRFKARTWEMQQRSGVSPHDAVGANLSLHVARNQVMRVVPRENEAVNQVWLADRDRYSHTGLYVEERLLEPRVKRDGAWQALPWEDALAEVASRIGDTVSRHGTQAIGSLASPCASTEELYLLQKLMRGIGSNNIDHRLRQADFRDQDAFPVAPGMDLTLDELAGADAILVVGSNTRKEQPLVNHRLRLAALRGAAVLVLNPTDYAFNFPVAASHLAHPDDFSELLDRMAAGSAAEAAGEIAQRLREAERAVVLLGSGAMLHPDAAGIRAGALALTRACDARLGLLNDGGNAAGAWLSGCVPHRLAGGGAADAPGRDASQMLDEPLEAYLLFGIDPGADCRDPAAAAAALERAGTVVAFTAYDSAELRELADIMLPIALYPETAGTFVNLQGQWQQGLGAVAPPGEGRPAWKVLRVLGNLLELDGFDFMDAAQVRAELEGHCDGATVSAGVDWSAPATSVPRASGLRRLGDVPIYATDALVRRAAPLQATADARFAGALLPADLAASLGLEDGDEVTVRQGDSSLRVAASVDPALVSGCVRLAAGVAATAELGAMYGEVEVSKP